MPPQSKKRKLQEISDGSKSLFRIYLEGHYAFDDSLTPHFKFHIGHAWYFLMGGEPNALISLLLKVYADDCGPKIKQSMRNYITKLQKMYKKYVHSRHADSMEKFKRDCESPFLWPGCVVLKETTSSDPVERTTFIPDDQPTTPDISSKEVPTTSVHDAAQPATPSCQPAMSSLLATPVKTRRQDPALLARLARHQLLIKDEELKRFKISSRMQDKATIPKSVRNLSEKLKRRNKQISNLEMERGPLRQSVINLRRRLNYAVTNKSPKATNTSHLTQELRKSQNIRMQLEEELIELKQRSTMTKKEGKITF